MRKINNQKGFTLIEMIGVLAVISILVAIVAPRVFETIRDTRPAKMAGDFLNYSTAAVNWYKDIENLASLSNTGLPQSSDHTTWHTQLMLIPPGNVGNGLWNRWRGPYIPSMAKPPFGDIATIINDYTDHAQDFDLDGDGNLDTTVLLGGSNFAVLVYLQVTGVNQDEFDRTDTIVDSQLTALGSTEATGKVEWDSGTGNMYVYLASAAN